jgi:hypothetical protein
MSTEAATDRESSFVAYEYVSVNVEPERVALYSDCNENFGWQGIECQETRTSDAYFLNTTASSEGHDSVHLQFKRDRKIMDRMQLNALQKRCDAALSAIRRYERQERALPFSVSLAVGIAATAFLAGSVFSFQANYIVLFILLGIYGVIGCGLPYFIFRRLKNAKAAEISPKIDQQYEVICQICEQAKTIWSA